MQDVLLFKNIYVREVGYLKGVLDIYHNNMSGILSLYLGLSDNPMTRINQIFPFQIMEFNGGLKYIGFSLKPKIDRAK